jgi:hypothetical protein
MYMAQFSATYSGLVPEGHEWRVVGGISQSVLEIILVRLSWPLELY